MISWGPRAQLHIISIDPGDMVSIQRLVLLRVRNDGDAPPRYAQAVVWAETRSDSKTQLIDVKAFSVEPHSEAGVTFDWSTLGTIGDVIMHAGICSDDGIELNTDQASEETSVILPPSGFGYRVQQSIPPFPLCDF